MNIVRKRLLQATEFSRRNFPFAKHKDLISFSVDGEVFATIEELDFNEVLVVVEKSWLFRLMKDSGLKTNAECLYYLQEEYTTEDSYEWYSAALLNNKIAFIDFN